MIACFRIVSASSRQSAVYSAFSSAAPCPRRRSLILETIAVLVGGVPSAASAPKLGSILFDEVKQSEIAPVGLFTRLDETLELPRAQSPDVIDIRTGMRLASLAISHKLPVTNGGARTSRMTHASSRVCLLDRCVARIRLGRYSE